MDQDNPLPNNQQADHSTPASDGAEAGGALTRWWHEFFKPGQPVADEHAPTPEEQQAMLLAQGGSGGFVSPDPITIQTREQVVQAIKDRANSIATSVVPGYGLVSGLINEAGSVSQQAARTDAPTPEEQQAMLLAQGGSGGFVSPDPITIQTGEQAKEAIENRLGEIVGAAGLLAAGAGLAAKVTESAIETGATAVKTAGQAAETVVGSGAREAESTAAQVIKGGEGAIPRNVLSQRFDTPTRVHGGYIVTEMHIDPDGTITYINHDGVLGVKGSPVKVVLDPDPFRGSTTSYFPPQTSVDGYIVDSVKELNNGGKIFANESGVQGPGVTGRATHVMYDRYNNVIEYFKEPTDVDGNRAVRVMYSAGGRTTYYNPDGLISRPGSPTELAHDTDGTVRTFFDRNSTIPDLP